MLFCCRGPHRRLSSHAHLNRLVKEAIIVNRRVELGKCASSCGQSSPQVTRRDGSCRRPTQRHQRHRSHRAQCNARASPASLLKALGMTLSTLVRRAAARKGTPPRKKRPHPFVYARPSRYLPTPASLRACPLHLRRSTQLLRRTPLGRHLARYRSRRRVAPGCYSPLPLLADTQHLQGTCSQPTRYCYCVGPRATGRSRGSGRSLPGS
jgi:hypothetical protein